MYVMSSPQVSPQSSMADIIKFQAPVAP